MWSGIRSFLSRHRRKFLVTGFVVGGAYIATRYVRNAMKEYHDKEMKEMLRRNCKQQHYDSIERLGNQTIISLSGTIHEKIAKLIDTESKINQLKVDGVNKIQIFEELKLLAFSKLTLLLYLSSIIAVTLRLQINLIGGYLYKGSNEERPKISDRIREKYLTTCSDLLTNGVVQLKRLIDEKVELVLAQRSLKEKLKLQDFEQILWAIHTVISEDGRNPLKHLSSYTLPLNDAVDLPESDVKMYQKVLVETRELFDSDEVVAMASSCIKRGFSFFVDNISEFFVERSTNQTPTIPGTSSGDDEANVNFITIPMAKVLPLLTAMTRSSGTQKDVPSAWIQQLILMDDLKVLGANVYECFSDENTN